MLNLITTLFLLATLMICFFGFSIAGLLIALEKFRVLRYLWNMPCYFCITFWLTLLSCIGIGFLLHDVWWIGIFVSLGAAALSRAVSS